ncbi:MAG: hypothetical protein D6798_15100 [Deltaproteobacteria bacterium]|nr:MAG: hypothetical protein D6798_15100 [Deltaproteobacteria bacterium]
MFRRIARPLRALLVLALGGALLSAGAWLVLAALGHVPGVEIRAVGLSVDLYPADGGIVGWIAAGSGLALVGLLVLLVSLTPAAPRQPASIELSGPEGDDHALPATTVRLSSRSLHALVAWLAGRVDGVRSARPMVSMGPDGWDVRLRVGLWATSSIPKVADELRRVLHDDLLRHTGVAMNSLQIDFDYGRRADADERPR